MARNPFYPGYYSPKQGTSPSNPMYPGYYPGRRVTHGPRPRGPKPMHFKGFGAGDSMAAFFEGLGDEVEETLRGPDRWLRERWADDFNKSFNIMSLPPQGMSAEALDDYETGSIPGGGFITLNIDPREWLGIGKKGQKWLDEDGTINRDKEAPKKMLKKTLTSWAKSAMNFNDLVTKARDEFWQGVFKDAYDPTEHSFTENLAYKFITGVEPDDPRSPTHVANPLSLSNKGVYEIYMEEGGVKKRCIFRDDSDQMVVVPGGSTDYSLRPISADDKAKYKFLGASDVFQNAGSSFSDYYRNAESVILRDQKYDLAMGAAARAASADITFEVATGLNKPNPAGITPLTPAQFAKTEAGSFLTRSELSSPLGGLGKALADANRDIKKSLASGLGLSTKDFEAIKESLKDVEEHFEKIDSLYSSLDKSALQVKHGRAFVAELDTNMDNLRRVIASPNFAAIRAASIPTGLSPTIAGVLHELNTSSGTLYTVMGGGFTGGDIFKPSLQRELTGDVLGELCSSKSLVGLVDNSVVTTGPLTGTLRLKATKTLRDHIQRAGADRSFHILDELEQFSPEATYWTKRLGRFQDTTYAPLAPKYLVERVKDLAVNFGLVLNDKDLIKKGMKWNRNVAPGKLFGNNFNVNFSFSETVGGITGTRKVKVKTYGGEHYDVITELEKKLNDSEKTGALITPWHYKQLLCNNKNILQSGITGALKRTGATAVNATDFVLVGGVWKFNDGGVLRDIFTTEFSGINLLSIYKVPGDNDQVLKTLKKLHAFQEGRILPDGTLLGGIAQLREHIRLRFGEAGLNPTNYDAVRSYIDRLQKISGNNNITTRHLGLLTKVSRGINKYQDSAYLFLTKIPIVGNIAKQVNGMKLYYKEALRRVRAAVKSAVEKAIKPLIRKVGARLAMTALRMGMKTAAHAIAQAAGSLAPIIGNLIAIVVVWLIEKAVKLVFKAIKGIATFLKRLGKGELSAYLQEVDKKLDKRAKRIMYIAIIIILINSFFASLIGSLIPDGVISPGGILTTDPFSDGVPFTLSTFSPTDPTRRWGVFSKVLTGILTWILERRVEEGEAVEAVTMVQ